MTLQAGSGVQGPSQVSLGRAWSWLAVLAAGTGVAAGAWAQALTVVPSIGVNETYTDNRDLRSGTERQSDLITNISPGLSLVYRRGPTQASLNYALNGLVHARESSLNSVFHTLNSTGHLEGWDGRLGVDAVANASRQVISPYGTQSMDPALNSGNQVQTFNYSLAPYLSGRLLGEASYRTRLTYAQTRNGSTDVGDTASLAGSVGLFGRRGPLGWSVDASRTISEVGDRPRAHNGRVGAGLDYTIDVDYRVSLRAGTEVDDMRSGVSERTTTWGAGFAWTPGPRTVLSFDLDRRFFGRSHTFSLSHRMARTVFTAADTRALNLGGPTGRAEVSLFDLFFLQFASREPDVARRTTLVRDFLAANGLDGTSKVVVGGFITAAPTVQRVQNLSVAYLGLRTTFSATWLKTANRDVDTTTAASSLSGVRQQGWTLSLSHRLTPEASLVVTLSDQHTSGNGSLPGNQLKSLLATWSSRLGPYTNVSLGLRHSQFDSETNPYTESAVLGSVRMQF